MIFKHYYKVFLCNYICNICVIALYSITGIHQCKINHFLLNIKNSFEHALTYKSNFKHLQIGEGVAPKLGKILNKFNFYISIL